MKGLDYTLHQDPHTTLNTKDRDKSNKSNDNIRQQKNENTKAFSQKTKLQAPKSAWS